jgi:hypothetical protein
MLLLLLMLLMLLLLLVAAMVLLSSEVYEQERMCDMASARAKMQAWSSDMTPSTLTLVYHR